MTDRDLEYGKIISSEKRTCKQPGMQEDLQEDDENKRTIIQKETMRWWPNNEIPYKLRKVFSSLPYQWI